MRGPIDAPTPAEPRPSPGRQTRARGGRSQADPRWLLRWVVVPGVLGSSLGILVAVVPWGRYILVFGLIISGLAWVLRFAGDWFVEHAGPQRGVVLLGAVLFGSWLLMALNPPGLLRGIGFGPIRQAR
jgi:hypothetical protein